MSKVGITLGVLVLGSGVSLTGAYALGAFDPDYTLTLNKIETETNKETNIRSEIKQEGCVKSLFGVVAEDTSVADLNSGESIDISSSPSNSKVPKEGCLVINWDKWKGVSEQDGKGKVSFRFLGAMKSDKKGFILFSTGESVKESSTSKLQFKGVAYVLEEADNKGKITKKKGQLDETKKLDDTKFPKAFGELSGMKGTKDAVFWGLTSDTDGEKFTKFETMDDAARKKDPSDANFRGYWTGKEESSGTNAADKWSADLGTGRKEVFGENDLKLEETVKDVKGTWVKRVIYPKPEAAESA